jgi:hypothetical protein
MADKIRVHKLVGMLSATSGEAANAAAMLSKIAAAENLTIGELMERTYSGKQGLDDIAEQVRASHAETQKWRATAEMWQAQAQARRAPEPQQAAPTPAEDDHLLIGLRWLWHIAFSGRTLFWRIGITLVVIGALGHITAPAKPAPLVMQTHPHVTPIVPLNRSFRHDQH